MAGVLAHPWFLQDLPAGALTMNAHYLRAPPAFPGEARAPASRVLG